MRQVTVLLIVGTLSACGTPALGPIGIVRPPAAAVVAQASGGLKPIVEAAAKAIVAWKDRNKDGVLSQAEVRFDDDEFKAADANADGKLTPSEFVRFVADQSQATAYIVANAKQELPRYDTNHDGVVSLAEVQARSDSALQVSLFAKADANRDQQLTLPEFEAFMAWWRVHLAETNGLLAIL